MAQAPANANCAGVVVNASEMIVLGPAVLSTAKHWNQVTVPACWPDGACFQLAATFCISCGMES
jgi:hypothetical protein